MIFAASASYLLMEGEISDLAAVLFRIGMPVPPPKRGMKMALYSEKSELHQDSGRGINKELVLAIALNFGIWAMVGVIAFMMVG